MVGESGKRRGSKEQELKRDKRRGRGKRDSGGGSSQELC